MEAALYDPRVSTTDPQPRTLIAQAASDERQLDGSRHLVVDADHDSGLSVSLSLIFSRDGTLDEADLFVSGSHGIWAGPVEGGATLDNLEPLSLRIKTGETTLTLLQRDDGRFDLHVDGEPL